MNRFVRGAAPAFVVVCAAAIGAAASSDPQWLDPSLSWQSPSSRHPLGCGEAGVDLLALVSHAALRGVLLAVIVAAAGVLIGAPLGAGAALIRGRFERVVQRTCDLVQAFPAFLLALAVLSSVRSPSRVHLALVFSLTAWAPFARLALAETRVIRAAGYVEASIALGAPRVKVLFRHVLPNQLSVLAVQLGSTAAATVVSEAALGFVGLAPGGGIALGSVLDQGVAAMLRAPHVLAVGSLAVLATSAALLATGRALAPR